jgi:alpha-aminoadipic semialdehyde synthase
VKDYDLVISYVPPPFHPNVAKACIAEKKNMVTASYISPEILALDQQFKDNDLICLFECGLDPGIDIFSTMKVLHETEEAGGK